MTKVLLVCPDITDACSFYRGAGVFNYLPVTVTVAGKGVSWADITAHDVVYLQRPFNLEHCQIINLAKACRVKVWCDFDDDVFNVPEHNPAYKVYSSARVRSQIAYCLKEADTVTVSTENLRNAFADIREEIHVVENAVNDFILRPNEVDEPFGMGLVWRGSNTHNADVGHYKDAITVAANKAKWTFIGPCAPFTKKLSNSEHLPFSPLPFYFNHLRDLQPHALVIPLVDNALNLSKSDVAYQEGLWAGAHVVCPNYGAFKGKGFNYEIGSNDSFLQAIEAALSTPRISQSYRRLSETLPIWLKILPKKPISI